jgi:GntR family transcriptional regulator
MPFAINTESRVPIYVQLKESIKLAIATGQFYPGAQLPTVRQLAVQLKINVKTPQSGKKAWARYWMI